MAGRVEASLSVTPSFFHTTSTQNGISAYDSDPGTLAHYQPFDIAEPLTDSLTAYSLNVNYSFPTFDVTSSTARWTRNSTQVEEASEAFNNPLEGLTSASYAFANPPGTHYANPDIMARMGPARSTVLKMILPISSPRSCDWLRRDMAEPAGLPDSISATSTHCGAFNGTTPNYSSYQDLGTLAPATTPNWFDAYSPTTLKQYAAFGDATYALTDALKVDVGARVNHYDYRFSSCISGWGSFLGAAEPSCRGLILLSSTSFNPKFNLSYTFGPDLKAYATVATGFRPGGGNALYPTTPGTIWGQAFQQQGYKSGLAAGPPRTNRTVS